MKITEHYNLHKPDQDDFYDVDVLNENMDKIDTVLKETQTAVSNPAEQAPVFTPAETRSSLVSGEKLGTLMGKIAKWLADLKDSAFATIANNCTTTEEGNVLDARQGQVLQGEVDEINSNIDTKLPSNVKFIVEGGGSNVKYYAQLGADTTSKKSLGGKIRKASLGRNLCARGSSDSYRATMTFNAKSIPGYQKLTVDNFSSYVTCDVNAESSASIRAAVTNITYDANAGTLTVQYKASAFYGQGNAVTVSYWQVYVSCDVFYIS